MALAISTWWGELWLQLQIAPVPKGSRFGDRTGQGAAVLLSFPRGIPVPSSDTRCCPPCTASPVPADGQMAWLRPLNDRDNGDPGASTLPTWLCVSVLAAAVKGSGTLHTGTPWSSRGSEGLWPALHPRGCTYVCQAFQTKGPHKVLPGTWPLWADVFIRSDPVLCRAIRHHA